MICEVKVGSSEGGNKSSDATHHPERAGVMRSFAPTGHRHTAEIEQAIRTGGARTRACISAPPPSTTCAACWRRRISLLKEGVKERDSWRAYRQTYRNEPFVRIVKERTGVYRYPEPKILSGSNYADVGFEFDAASRRVVAIGAIDNLMKGAAGTAVQCMNLMLGWDETTGLGFAGLHPI